MVMDGKVSKVVITYPDGLTRFGRLWKIPHTRSRWSRGYRVRRMAWL